MNNPKATKTRTLYLHHPNPNPPDDNDTNLETLAASMHRRHPNPKFPKRSRKIRSCWTSSKPEEDEEDEGFRSEFDDFRREDSLSPRADPLSETNGVRDWNDENHNGNSGLDEDGGVWSWLNRLGLGCYAVVFEIHEVDDEVLPLLTVEALKDTGINAVLVEEEDVLCHTETQEELLEAELPKDSPFEIIDIDRSASFQFILEREFQGEKIEVFVSKYYVGIDDDDEDEEEKKQDAAEGQNTDGYCQPHIYGYRQPHIYLIVTIDKAGLTLKFWCKLHAEDFKIAAMTMMSEGHGFFSLQVLCSALCSAEELACSAACYIARHLPHFF